MSGFIFRAFGARRRAPEGFEDRLRPGQYHESGFPVLTAGPTPQVELEKWSFRIREQNGYHARGDPWKEERYWTD